MRAVAAVLAQVPEDDDDEHLAGVSDDDNRNINGRSGKCERSTLYLV